MEVVRQHGDVRSVRALIVHVALSADAADSVLNGFRRFGDGDLYHGVKILDQLQAVLTTGNVAE